MLNIYYIVIIYEKNFQQILYKLCKYKTKKSINFKNDMYDLKYNKYKTLFFQKGGVLIENEFDIIDTELLKENIIKVFQDIAPKKLNDERLGSGQYGSVYLLLNNYVIKIINQQKDETYNVFKNYFVIEKNNNLIINYIAQTNLCFPKYFYHEMCELNILNDVNKRGIIISERLYNIYEFFDTATNTFKLEFNEQKINFYKQLYFIFYSLKDYYDKTGNIFIHNDFKLDNVLLRKIHNNENSYLYELANKTIIEIPYIVYNNCKWIIVLNDFGESYSYNKTTKKVNFKEKDSNTMLMFQLKYMDDIFDDTNAFNTALEYMFNHSYNELIKIECKHAIMIIKEINQVLDDFLTYT